jgi:electron transfer flavoprotein alpha subunit
MSNEIWAVVERRGDALAPVSREVLTAAGRMAEETGGQVAALFIGAADADGLAPLAFRYGAKKVYVASAPALERFVDDLYGQLLADAVKAHQPKLVLGPATLYGKAWFARAAALADAGLAPDVTQLAAAGDSVRAGRPCFGGNVVRSLSPTREGPLLATVRPKIFPEAEANDGVEGEVVRLDVGNEPRLTIKENVSEKGQTVNLNEADVIVAGGRGLREPDGFKLAFEMAEALDGAVGASRAVVDAGWIPYAHQVGQTGKTVNPKLYIALGISGAIQHLVGMQSAGVIVAINKDPDAPIFKVSTFGIVGDVFELAPVITGVFKAKLGS